MAISAKEFLKELGEGPTGVETSSKCSACGIALQETRTGCRHTDDGTLCSDCYFSQLGQIVEEFPITTPSIRRN